MAIAKNVLKLTREHSTVDVERTDVSTAKIADQQLVTERAETCRSQR
jgi:hypothetical protein